MELVGGLALLVAALVVMRLGRPGTGGSIPAVVRRLKIESVLAVVATAFVGLGLALTVSGAVSTFS